MTSNSNKSHNKNGPILSLFIIAKSLIQTNTNIQKSFIRRKLNNLLIRTTQVADSVVVPILKVPDKIKSTINNITTLTNEAKTISYHALSVVDIKVTALAQKLIQHDDVKINQNQESVLNKVYNIWRTSKKIMFILLEKGVNITVQRIINPLNLIDDIGFLYRKCRIPLLVTLSVSQQIFIDGIQFMLKNIGTVFSVAKQTLQIIFTQLPKQINLFQLCNCLGIHIINFSKKGIKIVINPSQFKQSLYKLISFILEVNSQAVKKVINTCSNSSKLLYTRTLRKIKQQKQIIERKSRRKNNMKNGSI